MPRSIEQTRRHFQFLNAATPSASEADQERERQAIQQRYDEIGVREQAVLDEARAEERAAREERLHERFLARGGTEQEWSEEKDEILRRARLDDVLAGEIADDLVRADLALHRRDPRYNRL